MKTRELVIGKYIDKSTYVLYREDGTVFQTIHEGEAFVIDNQFRSWIPTKEKKKKGTGTILMCKKYGDSGHVKEEFPLIHNKKGLWALTSGAARRGVFHRYQEPATELEKQLSAKGVSLRTLKHVEKIDVTLELGGELCSHVTNKWGYGCIFDGETENVSYPDIVPENHPNQYHRGCMASTYLSRILGGTYAIYYNIGTYMNGTRYAKIEAIYLTPSADENHVAEIIVEKMEAKENSLPDATGQAKR